MNEEVTGERLPGFRELPHLEAIEAAARRLQGAIHRTPLLSSRALGGPCGARVYLKCENLQRSGSFKIRGALNASLLARERGEVGPAGLLTYSSGNHGQAVALAARSLGVPAAVVAPRDIPAVKRAAIEGYGAQVIFCGLTSEERRAEARRIAAETGACLIEPFDHPDTIAGQGTVGLEIVEDLPLADAVLVPVGGGGLIAGVALAARARRPPVRVFGVEPAGADCLYRSLAASHRVRLEEPPRTVADGLRPVQPGRLPFLAAQLHVERVLVVPDEAILEAQERLLERAKLFAEPSGATAVAALLCEPEAFRELTVAVVLSGGNAPVPVLGARRSP